MTAKAWPRLGSRDLWHEGVPEWFRRALKAHDPNLDAIFYRWWKGADQTEAEPAEGRFLILVRPASARGRSTPPVVGDGQLNTQDWAVVTVLETPEGGMLVPNREALEQIKRSDRCNVEPGRFLRETRERADRAKKARQARARLETRQVMLPEILAGARGKILVGPGTFRR